MIYMLSLKEGKSCLMGTGEEGVPRRGAEVFKGLEERKCLSPCAVGTVGGREGGWQSGARR